MIPHMGKIKKWHFTHKACATCNFETYLHKVAKARIKQSFLESDSFYIEFNPLHLCAEEKCPIGYSSKCSKRLDKTFNLRQFYDLCEEEVEYGGFRPDLLFKSSTHPNREPIFIEIHVSHKSTAEKLSSEHRIIEISVQSEDDIDRIVTSHHIKGYIFSSSEIDKSMSKITFYNFHKTFLISPSRSFCQQKYIFAIKDNGYFVYSRCLCFEHHSDKFPPNEYNIIASNVSINWLWAFSEFQKKGLNVRNCLRCKFCKHTLMSDRICVLYKKFGIPKYPEIKQARPCQYYRIATEDESGTPIEKLSPKYLSCETIGNNIEPYYEITMHK